MQFMMILNEAPESFDQQADPAQASDYWTGWNAFIGAMMKSGIVVNPDLDTALDWAAKAPSAHSASVEIRPVLPMPDQRRAPTGPSRPPPARERTGPHRRRSAGCRTGGPPKLWQIALHPVRAHAGYCRRRGRPGRCPGQCA